MGIASPRSPGADSPVPFSLALASPRAGISAQCLGGRSQHPTLQGTNATRKPCSLYYYLPTKRKTNVVVRNTTPERKLSCKLRLGGGEGACGAQQASSTPWPTPQTGWEKWYPGHQLPAAAASIHTCQWESELGGRPDSTQCGALSPSPAVLLLLQLILQRVHPRAKQSSSPTARRRRWLQWYHVTAPPPRK